MPLDFRPKLDKIVELLLYLAHVRPDADKYQAVKFFYLADREHLNRYGRPITHEQYFALPYGPVASKAMDLLEEDHWTMTEAGIESLPFDIERTTRGDRAVTIIRAPKREVNPKLFFKERPQFLTRSLLNLAGQLSKSFLQSRMITMRTRRPGAIGDRAPAGRKCSTEDIIENKQKREGVIENIGPFASFME